MYVIIKYPKVKLWTSKQHRAERRRKMAQYSNGFSILASKETGEIIITFLQNQPSFNPESGKLDLPSTQEIVTVVMPFALGEKLKESIEEVVAKELEK